MLGLGSKAIRVPKSSGQGLLQYLWNKSFWKTSAGLTDSISVIQEAEVDDAMADPEKQLLESTLNGETLEEDWDEAAAPPEEPMEEEPVNQPMDEMEVFSALATVTEYARQVSKDAHLRSLQLDHILRRHNSNHQVKVQTTLNSYLDLYNCGANTCNGIHAYT